MCNCGTGWGKVADKPRIREAPEIDLQPGTRRATKLQSGGGEILGTATMKYRVAYNI